MNRFEATRNFLAVPMRMKLTIQNSAATAYGQNSAASYGRGENAAVYALTLVAAIVLGVIAAYWTWIWIAPKAAPRMSITTQPASGTRYAYAVFGTNAVAVVTIPTDLHLLGVIADQRAGRGQALLQLSDGKVAVVRVGQTVSSGVRLLEVHPDRVVLERNGAHETLQWQKAAVKSAAANGRN